MSLIRRNARATERRYGEDMIRTQPAIDFSVIRPNADVYGASGERIGRVIEVSGDRFHVTVGKYDAWVPNDWITVAHPRAVVVRFEPQRVREFGRAGSSRWARR